MFPSKQRELYVCISLDVEEEGLFSGHYQTRNVSTRNVSLLPALAPLSQEFGFPLTLFCAHSVFEDPAARNAVAWMRDNCGAEIGAHLHHWSTPPYTDEKPGRPLRTHLLEPALLRNRLDNLLAACADFQGRPVTSFRMGRWDLKAPLLPLLAEKGIRVDSSICPLRAFAGGPDHFMAPADPYVVELAQGREILEAPITQIPLSRLLARLWHGTVPESVVDFHHFFGALSANPLWHGDMVSRLATRLHFMRGGQVLSFFWHSSEIYPGGSPHVPDQKSSDALVKRIFEFCRWLKNNFKARGITASQLLELDAQKPFARFPLANDRDW